MADALLSWFRQSLPAEIASLTEPHLAQLETGQYQALLESDEAKKLFGHVDDTKTQKVKLSDFPTWSDYIFQRLGTLLSDRSKPGGQFIYFCIGYAALLSFLQSNVTGPPLSFDSARLFFSAEVSQSPQRVKEVRNALISSMSVDGIAVYKLTSNMELLCLADAIMTAPAVMKGVEVARWAKMRVAVMQQRLLSEASSTLQYEVIYHDLDMLDEQILSSQTDDSTKRDRRVEFLLERATIHLHHGQDKLARQDLEVAKAERRFEYVLTGLLGKRTKFQEKETSQLVVLARSFDEQAQTSTVVGDIASQTTSSHGARSNGNGEVSANPPKLDLNDDTLLESISFIQTPTRPNEQAEETNVPPDLQDLDPSNQPQLDPLDSTILLSLASSITNTSPQNGLTREETLPYATRVLEGGSSNWQVYTQALLVRSRIEGYKSRTIERGLLQLQALVDQVIADTSSSDYRLQADQTSTEAAVSFLPRPQESESAPVSERLRYIFQLASPYRWDLEAELASRWISLGGLRSALEIYERLEMWAEAALCWAATEQEDKAKIVVRKQLFHASKSVSDEDVGDDEKWEGSERQPPPLDAPRLYCILGDIDQSPEMYENAWNVSHQRYARAQRSLGRYWLSKGEMLKAADAYSKSLKVNQLNHSSWFALGCALLELEQYEKAVEAFSRCVQLDDTDAEAWSNLAAALLRKGPSQSGELNEVTSNEVNGDSTKNDEVDQAKNVDPQQNRLDALKALKRAAALKHESYRIMENLLTVAASLSPPDYQTMLSTQKRIIDLRGKTDGERCIDTQILEMLAQHVISSTEQFDPSEPGLARVFVKFMDSCVVPLITASAGLWQLVGKLALWRNKPSSALDAEEKAWRAVTSQPGWETDNEKRWNEVVEATVRLCDSYESLGPKERTEGMGAGELVGKDWKFKVRTAVRGIMGKGKSTWEGTDGWERLQEVLQGLKG